MQYHEYVYASSLGCDLVCGTLIKTRHFNLEDLCLNGDSKKLLPYSFNMSNMSPLYNVQYVIVDVHKAGIAC